MSSGKAKSSFTSAELRRYAEKHLPRTGGVSCPQGMEDLTRLYHELQIHQVELEMQNEELRDTRDRLDAALQQYTDLYEFGPTGYLTLNQAGIIQNVSLTGADLIGVQRSLLLGRPFEQLLCQESRTELARHLKKLFLTAARATCRLALLRQGQKPLWVQVEGVATTSGECRLALIDLTERLRAEEELQEKDRQLLQQNRLASMGEMINNIAHQWRQPLNVLGLMLQELTVRYDYDSLTRETLNDTIANSMNIIRHMSGTIDDFRDFFQADQEKVHFAVHESVNKTVTMIGDCFKGERIGVYIQVNSCPVVLGFPNQYCQVLLNILMNAKDALAERERNDASITITIDTEDQRSVVTIADNGGGVPEEIRDRIFEPYFTTKGPSRGTGIGLFMSKSIIEKNMGGRLTVRNTGAGAEFRILV